MRRDRGEDSVRWMGCSFAPTSAFSFCGKRYACDNKRYMQRSIAIGGREGKKALFLLSALARTVVFV